MSRLVRLACTAVLVASSACSGGSSQSAAPTPQPEGELPATPAGGMIGGASWQVAAAAVRPNADDGSLDLALSDVAAADPCKLALAGRILAASLQPTAGTHEFTIESGRLLTFSFTAADGSPELLAGEGRIVVDEITDAVVKGRIAFQHDPEKDEVVAGAFEAKRCNGSGDATHDGDLPPPPAPAPGPVPPPAPTPDPGLTPPLPPSPSPDPTDPTPPPTPTPDPTDPTPPPPPPPPPPPTPVPGPPYVYDATKNGCFNATGYQGYNTAEGECANLSGKTLSDRNFSFLTMRGVTFASSKLWNTRFVFADFTGAVLDSTDFRPADLSNVNFTNCRGRDARFSDRTVKLTSAILKGCTFDTSSFYLAQMGSADLSDSTLTSNDFREAVIDSGKFDGATLKYSRFFQTKLRSASFKKATLEGTEFIGADLSSANFTGATFKGSINLNNSNLVGTIFRDVDMGYTSLQLTDMSSADFRGADMTRTEGLNPFFNPKVRGAKFDARTKLPITREQATAMGMVYYP